MSVHISRPRTDHTDKYTLLDTNFMENNKYLEAYPWSSYANHFTHCQLPDEEHTVANSHFLQDKSFAARWPADRNPTQSSIGVDSQDRILADEPFASSCTTPSSFTSFTSSEWQYSELPSANGSTASSDVVVVHSQLPDQQIFHHCSVAETFAWQAPQQNFIGMLHRPVSMGPTPSIEVHSQQQPSAPEEVIIGVQHVQCGSAGNAEYHSRRSISSEAVSMTEESKEARSLHGDYQGNESGSGSSTSRRRSGTRTRPSSAGKAISSRFPRRSGIETGLGARGLIKRRASSDKTVIKQRQLSKVNKRPNLFSAVRQKPRQGSHSYPCVFRSFGCSHEFANKNEWKRHVSCQHLRLGFYRCDLGDCDPDNDCESNSSSRRQSSQILAKHGKRHSEEKIWNLFYRKDLFTQHCRRMHGPSRDPQLCTGPLKRGVAQPTESDEARFEQELGNIRSRCWETKRPAPPASKCIYCNQVFCADDISDGGCSPLTPEERAWEQRMEHIAQHIEQGHTLSELPDEKDFELIDWGLANDVFHRLEDGRYWLLDVSRRPSSSEAGAKSQDQPGTQRRRSSRAAANIRRSVHFQVPDATDDDSDAEAEDE